MAVPAHLAHLLHPPILATFVPGIPRSKGSLSPQAVRGGGGRLTGRTRLVDSPQSKKWRRTMAKHVAALWSPAEPVAGPVAVSAAFYFDRADYLVRADSPWPDHPHVGDLDKLVRNLLDALQVDDSGEGNGAGVFADDRQVVELVETRKVWAGPRQVAGVAIRVFALPTHHEVTG
jgi:Holliday junction resolvase RusA-like endonuclease